jgi:hypothetical protein
MEPVTEYNVTKVCSGADPYDISWKGSRGTTATGSELIFVHGNSYWGEFWDAEPLGLYSWTGSQYVDPASATAMAPAIDIVFNSPTTDIRLKSESDITVWIDTAGKVNIQSSARRYAYSLDKFVPYAGATGIIKYRENSADTWKGLKNVTSDSNGTYLYTYTAPPGSHRDYQVQIFDATNIFGNYSPVSWY